MIWLISASIIWGFSFGLIKGMTPHVNPFVLGAIRLAFAFGISLFFFRPKAVDRSTAQRMILVGFLQLGLMYAPYLLSFQFLKSYEVALFTMTTPLYVVALSQWQERRVTPRTIFAAIIAVVGGSVVAWKALDVDTRNMLIGILLVQCSNVLFALGQHILVRWNTHSKISVWRTMPFYFGGALAASSLSALVALMFGAIGPQVYQGQDWLVFAYLGLVATGLGFVVWNQGALKVNAGQLAVAADIKLPIAVLISIVVFREQAAFIQVAAGGALLIFAAWLVRQKRVL